MATTFVSASQLGQIAVWTGYSRAFLLFAITMRTTAVIVLDCGKRTARAGNCAIEARDFHAHILRAATTCIRLDDQLLAAAALRHRNRGAELLHAFSKGTTAAVLRKRW